MPFSDCSAGSPAREDSGGQAPFGTPPVANRHRICTLLSCSRLSAHITGPGPQTGHDRRASGRSRSSSSSSADPAEGISGDAHGYANGRCIQRGRRLQGGRAVCDYSRRLCEGKEEQDDDDRHHHSYAIVTRAKPQHDCFFSWCHMQSFLCLAASIDCGFTFQILTGPCDRCSDSIAKDRAPAPAPAQQQFSPALGDPALAYRTPAQQ